MQLLSPRQLAKAIGASESSLKRWADAGLIQFARTAGGHRRIELSEAIRFIRESKQTLLHPEILGLADVAHTQAAPGDADVSSQLRTLLQDGGDQAARGLILSLYLEGWPISRICDEPLRAAMREIGEMWKHDRGGICIEHHATDICIQAVNQLRTLLPRNEEGPIALGGGFPGDPYVLPSLCVAATLTERGYRAINLGPNLPFDSLLHAVDQHAPKLVWLSCSLAEPGDDEVKQLLAFAAELQHRRIRLALGGRNIEAFNLPPNPGFHVGRTMSELAAFADGVRSSSAEAE